MSDRINMSLALSHNFLSSEEMQTVYLMVQLKQPKIKIESDRLPVNVSFVLDRSGSMHGEKIANTKKALQFAIEHLGAEDTCSVVVFDNNVDVLLPAEKVVNKDYMIQVVEGLFSGGSTNLSGGLLKGASLVKENLSPEFVNRVLLLTDGLANAGITRPGRLVDIVKGLAEQKISVSTLGVGADFQEDLLVEMAEAGHGNFYFISSPDMIPDIFNQELQGLLSVTGQNLELGITPGEGVAVSAVLGYEPVWGPEVKVKLPDMYNGDVKTVLVELKVKAGAVQTMPLARVQFRYDDVLEGLASVKYDVTLNAEVTDNPKAVESGLTFEVLKEVEIFRTAQAREEAIKMADMGDFGGAAQVLQKQQSILHSMCASFADDELGEEASKLSEDFLVMEARTYDQVSRKNMKSKSFQQRKKR